MEEQTELEKEVGTIESEKKTLEPRKVKIVDVKVVPVGEKKSNKVNCLVEHPDYKDGTITLSSVSYLKDKKIITTGLWFNLDAQGNIQKNSALAIFLSKTGSKNLKELIGKEVDTELDGQYLCFKAY